MKLSRVRFSQTLDFPSPIRIIQTHKQIAFQNKNIASYNLKTRELDRSRHLSSFNESRQIEILSRRYQGLQICTFLKQFLSSLHVFNLTTCNDHLELTQCQVLNVQNNWQIVNTNLSRYRFQSLQVLLDNTQGDSSQDSRIYKLQEEDFISCLV